MSNYFSDDKTEVREEIMKLKQSIEDRDEKYKQELKKRAKELKR